ncbi:ankyrin repeat and KH domain-containing protein mask [Anoplophora glabripennis]|nr:ankyrin repeat and KH domain-containing protein mask [Anoplophora glabripennis]
MVRLLLEHNADVNLERPGTIDLLLECVLNCTTPLQANIINILIRHGKNINATDALSNRSCMHMVAMTGYIPVAESLLKMGGIVNIRDNFDYTPMKIANMHEHFETLKLMQCYNRLV